MEVKLVKQIKSNFEAKLATKTSWGRNEIVTILNESIQECALDTLEVLIENNNNA